MLQFVRNRIETPRGFANVNTGGAPGGMRPPANRVPDVSGPGIPRAMIVPLMTPTPGLPAGAVGLRGPVSRPKPPGNADAGGVWNTLKTEVVSLFKWAKGLMGKWW